MDDPGMNSTVLVQSPYLHKYWLVCESIFVVLTVVAMYLAVQLTKYACQRKSNSKTGRDAPQKIWLKGLCAASSIGFVLRVLSNHVTAFLAWQSDELCFATVTVSVVMFCLTLFPVYFFLWVRQSIFYTNPVIRKSLNPMVTRVSWLSLVFMIICALAMPILYCVPQITGWEYRATEGGCKEVSEDSPEIAPALTIVLTVIFQGILLGLFLYPMLSREMAKFRAAKTASPSKSANFKSSTLSRSDDHEGQNSGHEEYQDEVFHATTSRPGSPLVHPISPLALNGKQNFSFEKTPRMSDTDNESTDVPIDMRRNDSPDMRKPTTGIYHYTRGHNHSVSSENPLSPAVSDSEHTKLKGNTLMRTVKHKFSRTTTRHSKRTDAERRKRKEGRKQLNLMRKYCKLMALCVLSDVVATATQIAFVLPEIVYLLIFDINLLANLLCMVFTYAEWQVILFPWLADSEDSGYRGGGRLRRTPTPLRRKGRPDRVQELKREGQKARPDSPGARSSGSGYDSGDSTTQFCRTGIELRTLRMTSR